MSLAEEMLSTMSVSDNSASYLADEEAHIVINDSRLAIVPNELKTIAVTGDKDIETITFDCVRYWDGYDLSTFAIYLNYVLPDMTTGTYIPDSIVAEDDVYHFDWKIKNNITKISGHISFAITAIKTKQNESGETIVDQQWSSIPNGDCSIALGIGISNVPDEKESSDVLAQMSAILEQIQSDLKVFADVVQTTGQSSDKVMSQKATTDALKEKISGVKIDGQLLSIDTEGNVEIPKGNTNIYGVYKIHDDYGHKLSNGFLTHTQPTNLNIDQRNGEYRPISAASIDYAVKAAMCDGKGAAWTDTEKAAARSRMGVTDEINKIITDIPLVKSAEEPTIVDSVDEMTDTSKHYVLSTDGYFYGYKEGVNYNLLKLSEVSYSSRLQDDVPGIVASTAYNAVTGWIPVKYGKNYCGTVLIDGSRTYGNFAYQRMNLKLSDGTIIVYGKGQVPYTYDGSQVIKIEYENAVSMMLHFAVTDSGGAMVDISTSANLGAYQPMIVEGEGTTDTQTKATTYEYIDGDAVVPAIWYSTGLAYNQPADYEDRIIKLEKMVNPTSASPYYRDVNFGIIPSVYYKGVAETYTEIFGELTNYATFIASWKSLVASHSGYVTETTLGTASDGQSVYLYDFKPVRIANQRTRIPKIIIVAGQHGFEKSNIYGLHYFVDNLLNRWNQSPALEYLRNHVELMIVPVLNTYGFDHNEYKNANGVNLNRNYNSNWQLVADTTSSQYGGSAPFDQPETQIVRDLIFANSNASLVVDFHTNGGASVSQYDYINYYGVSPSTDAYYNRILDAVSHQLASISANFNLDYSLNHPDTMLGWFNNVNGIGLLRDWATENNFICALVEGFNGFPNDTPFVGKVYKANEEIIVNWLITAMNYLSK